MTSIVIKAIAIAVTRVMPLVVIKIVVVAIPCVMSFVIVEIIAVLITHIMPLTIIEAIVVTVADVMPFVVIVALHDFCSSYFHFLDELMFCHWRNSFPSVHNIASYNLSYTFREYFVGAVFNIFLNYHSKLHNNLRSLGVEALIPFPIL